MTNSITQLFSLTCEEQPLHSEIHETMLCPTSGQIEPMRLQLYKQYINSYGIFKRTPAKPSARFFRIADEAEIEAQYWTKEMTKAYETAIKGNSPVAGKRVTVTTYGKVVITFLLLALAMLIYQGYHLQEGKMTTPVLDSINTQNAVQ